MKAIDINIGDILLINHYTKRVVINILKDNIYLEKNNIITVVSDKPLDRNCNDIFYWKKEVNEQNKKTVTIEKY